MNPYQNPSLCEARIEEWCRPQRKMINFLLLSLWATPTLNSKSKKRALEEFSIKIRVVHKEITRTAKWWVLRCLWTSESSRESWTSHHLKLRAYVNMLFALEKPQDWQEIRTACIFREKRKGNRKQCWVGILSCSKWMLCTVTVLEMCWCDFSSKRARNICLRTGAEGVLKEVNCSVHNPCQSLGPTTGL